MNKRYLIVGLILTAALVGGVLYVKKIRPAMDSRLAAGESKAKGPENAPVQIVEYSDFQCPVCQKAQPILTKIFNDHPGKIRIVFRHFPLQMHIWSPLAHQAAECANQSGQFWNYQDKLYANQSEWSTPMVNPTEKLLRYAQELQLDLDAFAKCLTDTGVRSKIKSEYARGVDLQVNATPTFFINGERLVGPQDLEIKGEPMVNKILQGHEN